MSIFWGFIVALMNCSVLFLWVPLWAGRKGALDVISIKMAVLPLAGLSVHFCHRVLVSASVSFLT